MVNILDCTLRDGSYVNNFQFTAQDTHLLCQELETAGIRYIEIGHGLGLGAYRKGPPFEAAATDEQYLKAASKTIKKASFGMFCIPGFASLEDIDLACSYGMSFIRIGVNVTEIEKSAPFIEKAKKKGLFVCTNYMKSYVVPPSIFMEKAGLSKSYGADVVYLVDSAGGMLPHEVSSYIKAVKDHIGIDMGFHGHNNLGLAVSNSLLCVTLGVKFIDTCLQGLGRSAGNASTEQFVLLLSRMGLTQEIDLFKILDLGFEKIQPILVQMGLNPIDLISGFSLFHSSYMPLIKKYSNQYCVDPRELIIELCKVNQAEAPPELVEKIASHLIPKTRDVFFGKYHLERYYINEQQ